jgi:2,3-bisphosphoglycerate-independent phosphoglycerate mutase
VVPAAAVFRATAVHLSGPLGHRDTRLLGLAEAGATREAVAALVPLLAARGVALHPDPQGRHLVVVPGAPERETVPPHDLVGLPIAAAGPLPVPGLWEWIQGRLPGDLALWPWGAGGAVPGRSEVPFGVLITGVDLVRGIGRALGLACPRVPGATGGEDADFGAKARAVLAALAEDPHGPAVAVHVEAPDMAAHRRDPRAKAAVLERIDRDLVGPLAAAGVRLVVTADHGTSSRTGRHLEGPVPFLLAEPGAAPEGPGRFDEGAVAGCPVLGPAAWRAMLAEVGAPC